MLTQGKKTGFEGEWMTPPELIVWLENRFGKFDLDIAASVENHICDRYFTKENSALHGNGWNCRNGFINPPFTMIPEFWKIAEVETRLMKSKQIIMLFPVNTVGNKWWIDMQENYPFSCRIELNPRVQYIPHPDNTKGFDKNGKPKNCCNGPSQIVVFNQEKEKRRIYWEQWK